MSSMTCTCVLQSPGFSYPRDLDKYMVITELIATFHVPWNHFSTLYLRELMDDKHDRRYDTNSVGFSYILGI